MDIFQSINLLYVVVSTGHCDYVNDERPMTRQGRDLFNACMHRPYIATYIFRQPGRTTDSITTHKLTGNIHFGCEELPPTMSCQDTCLVVSKYISICIDGQSTRSPYLPSCHPRIYRTYLKKSRDLSRSGGVLSNQSKHS